VFGMLRWFVANVCKISFFSGDRDSDT
jgi:hypothetical protein